MRPGEEQAAALAKTPQEVESGKDAAEASTALARRPAGAEEFIAARNASTRAGFLSPLTAADLGNHRLFLSGDGKVYALDSDGDLQNLFNNGGPPGAGQVALVHAIQNGANSLDAFDGHLTDLYSRYGFVPTSRVRFSRDFAPPGWDYNKYGEPDVVLMRYAGGDPATIGERVGSFPEYHEYDNGAVRLFDDYADAKAHASTASVDGQSVGGREGGILRSGRGGGGAGGADIGQAPDGYDRVSGVRPQLLGATERAERAEMKRFEEATRLADRIGELENTDPEEAVRELRTLVERQIDQADQVVEDAGRRIVKMSERLKAADPELVKKRVVELEARKADVERRFGDRYLDAQDRDSYLSDITDDISTS